MTSALRRSAVPLIGATLVVIVIVVALVVLDLGSTGGDSSAIPIIHIGQETTVQGQGNGTGQGQGGTGSSIHGGQTTVITGEVRVEPGHQYQGGASNGQGK